MSRIDRRPVPTRSGCPEGATESRPSPGVAEYVIDRRFTAASRGVLPHPPMHPAATSRPRAPIINARDWLAPQRMRRFPAAVGRRRSTMAAYRRSDLPLSWVKALMHARHAACSCGRTWRFGDVSSGAVIGGLCPDCDARAPSRPARAERRRRTRGRRPVSFSPDRLTPPRSFAGARESPSVARPRAESPPAIHLHPVPEGPERHHAQARVQLRRHP
jgi:hypothetical protein